MFKNQMSLSFFRNFSNNFLLANASKHTGYRPLLFAWFITNSCNYKCEYCVESPSISTHGKTFPLTTEKAKQLLDILKKECPNLHISGGEPLTRPDIIEILKYARKTGFKSLSLVTNMSLIHKKPEVVDYVNNLVCSLDMVDAKKYSEVVGVPQKVVEKKLKNIEDMAKLQRSKNFTLTANLVLNEHTLPDAKNVVRFCTNNKIKIIAGPEVTTDFYVRDEIRNNKL
jgi:MoaA/NifB/PqqE/SkfB family radical SAM enzyme